MADSIPLVPAIVTPDAVRMFLIDRRPEDNFLLDATEFSPAQVAGALQLCVDKYNSTTPLLNEGFNVDTFPYRYEGVIGTAAILLRMMAVNLTRNRLDYSTQEGTAVQDRARAQEYVALAKDLSAEFDARIKALKVQANLQGFYGGVRSQFSYGAGFGL